MWTASRALWNCWRRASRVVASDTPKGGAWKYHWKMTSPHASYLVPLAAGEFARLEDHAGDVPLVYLVPKGREEDGARTFERTPAMVKLFDTGLTPVVDRTFAMADVVAAANHVLAGDQFGKVVLAID